MPKIKTSELSGAALDWAVAIACKYEIELKPWLHLADANSDRDGPDSWRPSACWRQGGPLVELHRVKIAPMRYSPGKEQWVAGLHYFDEQDNPQYLEITGTSALNATCRAIVSAHLGDEVDIPEELV